MTPPAAPDADRFADSGQRPPRQGLDPLVWLLPVILLALAAIVISAVVRRSASDRAAVASPAVTAAVVAEVTGVPAAAWNAAGAAGAIAPLLVPAADRVAGAPTVLYVGAEWCPYCAAERWPLASALARFGTFQGLQLTTSSSSDTFPNTPTLTFAQATFTGPPLDVETVEVQNRQRQPLQGLTAPEAALLQRYDAPPYVPADARGGIPFLLIGGRYFWPGSQFSPQLLHGLTWSQAAAGLAAAQTGLARTILANGNELAAAICAVDGAEPPAVCTSAGVQAAAALLPAG